MKQILSDDPSVEVDSGLLVGKLVQALESDASWVDLYGITGELVVPKLSDDSDEFSDLLLQAMDVGVFSSTRVFIAKPAQILKRGRHDEDNDGWREIVIPVDVPQVHVSYASISLASGAKNGISDTCCRSFRNSCEPFLRRQLLGEFTTALCRSTHLCDTCCVDIFPLGTD